MSQKKRLPPWEEARIVFQMQEQARKRKLMQEDMKGRRVRAKRVGPNTLDELEENRKRLALIEKRILEDPEKK